MPTVIDSLVVELRLQSAQFASEGRQATTEFTRMQQQVQRASQTIGQAFSRGGVAQRSTREFLSTFENQLDALTLTVNNLGNQTRRTGREIEGAGKTGAAGLFSLGAAALSAFAALKAVQGVVKSIGDATDSVAHGNRADWAGNLNPEWRQRFEQYAYRADKVPYETTRGTLVDFAQKLEAFQRGERIPGFGELARIGVNFNQRPEQVIEDLTKWSQGRQGGEVTGWLGAAGFGQLARTIGRGHGEFQQGMSQSGATILGPDQRKNIDELWQAVNRFTVAWDSLTQKIIAANPHWTLWINSTSKFLEDIQNDSDAIDKLSIAANALAVAIGATLVKAVWAFSKAILGANAEILSTPLGQFLLGGYAAYKLLEKGLEFQKTPQLLPPGQENNAEDDTGTFGLLPGLIKRGWNWLTRDPKQNIVVPAPPPLGKTGGAGGDLDTIEKYESGGRNIHQRLVDPRVSSAQGFYQITNTTWRGAAPAAGVDLAQYPNAMSAPKEVQARVATELIRRDRAAGRSGFSDWAPFNPALAAALRSGENRTSRSPFGRQGQGPGQGQDNIVVPPHQDMGDLRPAAAGGTDKSGQYRYNEDTRRWDFNDKGWGAQVASVRNNQAGGGPSSPSHNTHNDNDFHGGINVTVPAGSDGYAVGGAISRRLKDEMLVGTINTGI